MTKLQRAMLAALGLSLVLNAPTTASAGAAGKVMVVDAPAWAAIAGSPFVVVPSVRTGDPRLDNELLDARIRLAIGQAFTLKGLRESQNPALARYVVSYRVAVTNEVDVRSSCAGRFCRGQMVDVDQYREAHLVVDIVDRQSGRLVWRALSEKRVGLKSSDQATLNAVMMDIAKRLPVA